MDELTVGIERLITPALTVGLKGTYRSLSSTLEDRCDFDYTSPLTGYNSCALINPGSDGKFASGDAPTCNGLFDNSDWYQCYPTGPASPEVKRYYRGIELFARQSVGNSLWLQASYVYSTLRGNFDGGVNQADGQTWPGINGDFDYPELWHNAYGTLALDRTNRFRFDGFWVTPWLHLGWPPGLRRDRRAAQQDGLLQQQTTARTSSSCPGVRPGACRPSGGQT